MAPIFVSGHQLVLIVLVILAPVLIIHCNSIALKMVAKLKIISILLWNVNCALCIVKSNEQKFCKSKNFLFCALSLLQLNLVAIFTSYSSPTKLHPIKRLKSSNYDKGSKNSFKINSLWKTLLLWICDWQKTLASKPCPQADKSMKSGINDYQIPISLYHYQ